MTMIPKRILIVDDEVFNIDIIGKFLRHGGYALSVALSGAEAVRMASTEDFDLILMDVRMPGMDGMAATRIIRALLAPRCQVPIYAVTFFDGPQQLTEYLACGMNGLIQKPDGYAELIGAVEAALAA